MTTDAATLTTNGAGAANIQFLFLDSNKRVVNCLPGYWGPEILLKEFDLTQKLVAGGRTANPIDERDDNFMIAHLNHAVQIAEDSQRDSHLQGFDEAAEMKKEDSLFRRSDGSLKTVDQVVHEKMARLPYLQLEKFDIARFVAYGTKFYDKYVPGTKRKMPQKPTSRRKSTSRPRTK